MRHSEIEINTDQFGYLNVEFSYFHNGDYFEYNAIESILDAEDNKIKFEQLNLDTQKDIEQIISEFCVFDANIGDYFESHEEEMR